MDNSSTRSLPRLPLPVGVAEDYVDCTSSCGLEFHILKAGQVGKPLVLFAHGFPELAFSWRKVLPAVASQGYYCIAMDQRGYGRTTGWDRRPYHEVNLADYVITNLVRDMVCLVYKLGYTDVHSIIGHDFGAVISAMAGLMRPDMFKSTIQMSVPHNPPPTPDFGDEKKKGNTNIHADLAALSPPRKHYQLYYATAGAAGDLDNPPQGLEAYLRGQFHLKSADWAGNNPHPLAAWSAQELEGLPEYYIMRKDQSMAESVASNMKGEHYAKSETWLPKEDLEVYTEEWRRTGFQGALNWYRAQTGSTPETARDMLLFAGRRIEVPCAFISGKQDWGTFQRPGALQNYNNPRCVKEGMFKGGFLVDGAGHWVQQEQVEKVVEHVNKFLSTV